MRAAMRLIRSYERRNLFFGFRSAPPYRPPSVGAGLVRSLTVQVRFTLSQPRVADVTPITIVTIERPRPLQQNAGQGA